MEIRFNLTGAERKPLALAVSEIMGSKAVYMRAPTYGYEVQGYTIDRDGTLICDGRAESGAVHSLLSELAARGFVYEDISSAGAPVNEATAGEHDGAGDAFAEAAFAEEAGEDTPAADAPVGEHSDAPLTESAAVVSATAPSEAAPTDTNLDRLVVEVPLEGFTPTALDNLDKLVASKAELIKKSLGASDLPIIQEGDRLCFPWFSLGSSPDRAAAYTQFVHALCEMARKQQRVVAKEKPADSEKFAFRCFLLRLGFIGLEYAAARKLLLANLPGDGSFKSGKRKERDEGSEVVVQGANTADSGGDDGVGPSAGEDGSGADSAETGGLEGAPDPYPLAEALADAELVHGVNMLLEAEGQG